VNEILKYISVFLSRFGAFLTSLFTFVNAKVTVMQFSKHKPQNLVDNLQKRVTCSKGIPKKKLISQKQVIVSMEVSVISR